MLPRTEDVPFSGKVVVVSAALLIPAALLLGWSGAVTWPVIVVLAALGALFVAMTAPLWNSVTPRNARRGFLFSGPYLLSVVLRGLRRTSRSSGSECRGASEPDFASRRTVTLSQGPGSSRTMSESDRVALTPERQRDAENVLRNWYAQGLDPAGDRWAEPSFWVQESGAG